MGKYAERKTKSHHSSKEEQKSGENIKDGARAWVVAVAGSMTFALTLGLYRSAGIILVEMMELFEASTTQSSLLFACFGITYCVTALFLNTLLGGVVHERALIVIGACVGALGFIISFFASRVEHITFGLGLCLGSLVQGGVNSSLSITGRHFVRRLTIGSGVVVSGGGIGLFVWPVLIQYLLNEYTLRGTCLILAGVILNCFVGATLMKPLPGTRRLRSSTIRSASAKSTGNENYPQTELNKPDLSSPKPDEDSINIPQDVTNAEDVPAQTAVIPNIQASTEVISGNKMACIDLTVPPTSTPCQRRTRHVCFWNALEVAKDFVLMRQSDKLHKKTFGHMLALALLKNPRFVLFQLYSFIVAITAECVVQFYPAILHDIGLTEYQSATLLSLVGLSGLVGRLVSGFLGDYITKRYKVVLLSQAFLGLAVVLNQFARTFWPQVVYALVVGIAYGIPYGFRIAILKDFFIDEDLAKMLGITGFTAGLAMICGGPIVGWLRDSTDGYLLPLYVFGALCLLNCLIIQTMALLKTLKDNKRGSFDVQNNPAQVA